MNVVRSLSELTHDRNSVVTVGTFDGVHRAHREIMREVATRARKRKGRSVVVTFDPHPKEIVSSARGPVKLLTTLEERIALIGSMGIDLLLVIAFTSEFSRLGSQEFFTRYVVSGVGVIEAVVGYDHMFGRDREAGIGELERMGNESGFTVVAMPPYTVNGEAVSSTRIRRALAGGDVEGASALLGASYSLSGIVVPGDRRGATIGFPTANVAPSTEKKIVPGRGVYFVSAQAAGGRHFGMLNVGVRPTLTDGARELIEVHLLDFSGDLYGRPITVEFLRRLRDEQRFASVGDLRQQLMRDQEQSRTYAAEVLKQHQTIT